MKRRTFALAITALIGSIPLVANAGIPLIPWILRFLIPNIERQAVQSAARAAATQSARVVVPQAAVVAERSTRLARILREISIATAGSVAATEVLAMVKETPEDSILRHTLAYFEVLTRADPEAAMAMWIDPKELDFQHLTQSAPTFRVTDLQEVLVTRDKKIVRVFVKGAKPGEEAIDYNILIIWRPTEFGWRIDGMPKGAA